MSITPRCAGYGRCATRDRTTTQGRGLCGFVRDASRSDGVRSKVNVLERRGRRRLLLMMMMGDVIERIGIIEFDGCERIGRVNFQWRREGAAAASDRR